MTSSKLRILISNEYSADVSTRSFWITTILIPIVYIGFCYFISIMTDESFIFQNNATSGEPAELSPSGNLIGAIIAGILLPVFLMIYGARIYNKVKKEKINRIIEILATSVNGRTLMLAKILSVLFTALTQIGIWGAIGLVGYGLFSMMTDSIISPDFLINPRLYTGTLWIIIFFIGGYLFYGSLYAACGAITDKDNENHGYLTLITFLLLGSFYIEQYAVDNMDSIFVTICSFIPFTAPAVATVGAVSGATPIMMSIGEALVLYAFAYMSIILSGKIYTSSILLKGKKISPADLCVFLKSK